MTVAQDYQSLLETCLQTCLDCLRDCENCAPACLSSSLETLHHADERCGLASVLDNAYVSD